MDLLAHALKLLELKSISEEGDEELVNYLIPLFEQIGARLVLQQVPHSMGDHAKRQYNLIGILGDDLVDSRTKKGLLLTSHVDTASPGNAADWNKLGGNPWAPALLEGGVYGLGAASGKLDFLCKLIAGATYAKHGLKQPIYIVATCGGESPLAGCKYLIQSGAVNPKYVLVGAPTGLNIVNAQKMQMSFAIRISFVAVERDAQEFNAKIFVSSRSKSCHVAHPKAEKNALSNVLFFLDQLRASPIQHKLFSLHGASSLNKTPDNASAGVVVPSKDLDAVRDRFRSISSNHRDCFFEMRLGGTGDRGIRLLPAEVAQAVVAIREELDQLNGDLASHHEEGFDPPRSKITFSGVSQGRDCLDLLLHFHLVPEFGGADIKKELEADLKARLAKIVHNYRTISIDCRRLISTPKFYTDPKSTFVQTLCADLASSGVEPIVRSSNNCSEAAYFSERGYETVAFGAGQDEDNMNCPNEQVRLDDLHASIRFYERAIEAFCVRGI